ncbi:lipase family protein [Pseudomonas sp. EA_35y_Pfl2_R5]|uniref:lipase family protein n=1 Tax=Pseudomonas sp. EA_35y_Pfl2_R5 TaxID=3088690 RepID=UPI0030DD63E9
MNDSVKTNRVETLNCPLREHWISFRLVDEHGDGSSYAGLPYKLHDSQGQQIEGILDSDGFARAENIYCGPIVLDISGLASNITDKWYKELTTRKAYKLPLTALQVAAEQSPTGPRRTDGKTYLAEERAVQEKARFHRVEVSDFAEVISHLPRSDSSWHPRPSASLKQSTGLAKEQLGTALAPNQHHVLEVKALRAYRPLLSLSKEFNALDAYQFALMATQSYAPFNQPFDQDPKGEAKPPYSVPGTLGHVLDTTLAHCTEPDTFGGATPYHLLTEEVPYSKRLEIVPHDNEHFAGLNEERRTPQAVHFLHQPANILRGTLGEAQAFITHDDRMVLIVARGTQEIADWVRDVNATQVPNEAGEGQAHHGFHESFKAVRDFVVPYLEFARTNNQKIVVCGHSLGGAIALLMAEWIRNNWSEDVLLYTYGSPRAGDEAFVKGASALTHHRIVNHNDLIPTVPAPWMDTKGAMLWPGAAALIGGSTGVGALLFLAGMYNFSGDDYQHHGQQWHFMPLPQADGPPTSVLWKPGCTGIEEATCARYNYLALKGDMPERSSLSVMDHTMLGGYIPACHATLLRWQESLKRGGSTLTNLEQKWLSDEIETYGKKLRRWKNVTWSQYKNDPRNRSIPTWDLRRNYQEAKAAIEEDVTVEIDKLDMTLQRLALLAKQPITSSAVYGNAQNHPEFEQLVARWLAHNENRKTPQLARIPSPSRHQYA